MKKILFLLILIATMFGCKMSEEVDIEINPRPSLRLAYEYTNSKGYNTTKEELRMLNVTVVNDQGAVVRNEVISKAMIADYRPLYGVPEGDYTVITFGNVDSSTIVNNGVALPLNKIHTSTDELFHKIETFHVERGHAKLNTISLDKLFYKIDLSILGLKDLADMSPSDFSVEIAGIPSGFSSDGQPLFPISLYPRLNMETDIAHSFFSVYKFKDAASINLTLKYRSETIANFPLSVYLSDSKSGIDFVNDKDIVIPIEINVTSLGIGITINDWFAAVIQWSNNGN